MVQQRHLVDLVQSAMNALASPVREEVELEIVEGTIPPEIDGVLLRNGPGRQARGGQPYGHPFDGDGFVQRLAISGGKARYRADWVRTREWKAEEEADRILYRGFGTNRPGGLSANLLDVKFKNAANTSIITHAGRTLTLWEGGIPHEVDPDTLETRGRFDFDGGLQNRRSVIDRVMNPELPFAAHPRLDPHTGELWSFGAAYGLKSHLLIHRVAPSGELQTHWLGLPQLPFVHDFALTRRYCVFVLPAVSFDIPAAIVGWRTPVTSLRLKDEPGLVLLWPRDGGEPRWAQGPKGFVFHWAHAYEDDAGNVVLTGMHYPTFPRIDDPLAQVGKSVPSPIRLTVDPEDRTRIEPLTDHLMELPTTSTPFDTPTGAVFGVAGTPDLQHPVLTGLGRLEPDSRLTYRELYPRIPGEPLPVADGRWLVTWVFDPEGPSEIWVVDPTTLETQARLRLPHAVPPALHGQWTPADPEGSPGS